MKRARTLKLAIASLALLAASCVELTGQRVAIRYDAARDVLLVLIHYDGIHDSGGEPNGREQIPEFIGNGSVLFLDWPFHVKMDEVRKAAREESTPPALRTFLEAVVSSVVTHPIGRYRDPDGKVGAAQLVEVRGARDFLRKANAALSAVIIEEDGIDDMPLSSARMVAAARAGKQWIEIEGASLRLALPFHPREWAALKARVARSALEGSQDNDYLRAFHVQMLALSTTIIREEREEIVFRLGDRDRPATLRFLLRSAYSPDLEEVLARSLPADLDEALGRALMEGAGTEVPAGIAAVLEWGPPEEKVRALVAAAAGPDEARRKAAVERLRGLGRSLADAGDLPAPPPETDDLAATVESWKDWYRRTLRFPDEDD